MCGWFCQLAGAVIGKAGNRIKQIQAESGTMIKLDEADVAGEERVISITGYPDEIEYAQYLLQQAWVLLLLFLICMWLYSLYCSRGLVFKLLDSSSTWVTGNGGNGIESKLLLQKSYFIHEHIALCGPREL